MQPSSVYSVAKIPQVDAVSLLRYDAPMESTKSIRDRDGRFMPGTSSGPGRKPLPAWLTGKTDELLELQYHAATKGTLPQAEPEIPVDATDEQVREIQLDAARASIVRPEHRLRAAENLLDRVLGRPQPATEETPGASAILLQILKDEA